ncbi:hypothetical protein BGZ65_010014, partial [Modicella reniformis]
ELTLVAELNFAARGKMPQANHTMVLIPGGAGIGKSRAGWESQFLTTHSEVEKFREALSNSLYILIDFSNGYQYTPQLDEQHSPGIRIGARIAVAAGLIKSKFDHLMIDHSVEDLDIGNVMERILDLRLRQSGRSVEAVIIHLDEYQLYICNDERGGGRSWDMARERFKAMLKQIGNLMRQRSEHRDYFIIPICTGTSAVDIHFLPTEYHRKILLLKPLTYESAKEMFLDMFEYQRQEESTAKDRIKASVEKHLSRVVSQNTVSQRSSELCDYVLGQAHFNIALYDSGFIPRFLDCLLEQTHISTDTDWGKHMYNCVFGRYGTVQTAGDQGSWRSYDDIRTIISLAMTRHVITRSFQLPSGARIGDVERDGLLFLSPEQDGLVIVMPFVYLKVLNEVLGKSQEGRVFPSALLLIPTAARPWQWQDFEQLHGHYQKVLIGSLIDVGGRDGTISSPLSAVFRGGAGSTTLLSQMVRLCRVEIHTEKDMFLRTTTDTANFRTTVLCKDGISRQLTEGIYHCADGCALIDHRWALSSADSSGRPFAIFMQDKHSHLATMNPTINQNKLQEWYEATMHSVRRYKKKFNIVLVMFTVRRVTTQNLSRMPNLILIDMDKIQDYLSPTFAQRGLVQAEIEDEQVLTQPMDIS